MKPLHTLVSLIVVCKYALAIKYKGDPEYTLDLVGDNNWERIDTDYSDRNVTVFRPIGAAIIGVVKYGNTVLWKRRPNLVLEKVLLFRMGDEHRFIHLHYREGKRRKALILVRDGDKWKLSGRYNVKKSDDDQWAGATSEGGSEPEEKIDLDIAGDPSNCCRVKEYLSLELPTTEFTRFASTAIQRVVDGFQTIWSRADSGKDLSRVFLYSKPGHNELLVVSMGASIFNPADAHYEKVGQNWTRVPRKHFYERFKIAMSDVNLERLDDQEMGVGSDQAQGGDGTAGLKGWTFHSPGTPSEGGSESEHSSLGLSGLYSPSPTPPTRSPPPVPGSPRGIPYASSLSPKGYRVSVASTDNGAPSSVDSNDGSGGTTKRNEGITGGSDNVGGSSEDLGSNREEIVGDLVDDVTRTLNRRESLSSINSDDEPKELKSFVSYDGVGGDEYRKGGDDDTSIGSTGSSGSEGSGSSFERLSKEESIDSPNQSLNRSPNPPINSSGRSETN